MPENTVYVGRPSGWGNPFVVGKHGTRAQCAKLHQHLLSGYLCTSTGNIQEQREYIDHLSAHIDELKGKNLACWCGLDSPCHADLLLEAVQERP